MTILIVGGVVLLLIVVFVFTRTPAPVRDADAVYWDDDDYEAPIQQETKHPSARFAPGMHYRWEQIEDLLWSYGYTREEVQAMWKRNYAEIYRDGLSAAFDGSGGARDAQDNQLYWCNHFDPEADTARSDRWRRQPTDDERRSAVWERRG